MKNKWTTSLPGMAEHARRYGVESLHYGWFCPPGWPGKGPAVCLLIPECELQLHHPDKGVIIVKPSPEDPKDVKRWTEVACRHASVVDAALNFACDTSEQVEIAARRVAKFLPRYQRIPLERMVDPRTRSPSSLN